MRSFVGLGLDGAAPDHAAISRARRLIDVETHRTVFTWVQVMERVLKETVARCGEGTGSHCPLIEALYRDGDIAGRVG